MKSRLNKLLQQHANVDNIIYNVNWDPCTHQKRALISYINYNLKNPLNGTLHHTSLIDSSLIIKAFINSDYCIDIVDCLDTNTEKLLGNRKYDVIFGFGLPFHKAASTHTNIPRIFYCTEGHPEFSLKAEMERVNYFNSRKKQKAKLRRSGVFIKLEHMEHATDAIILGDPKPFEQLPLPIHTINPTGFTSKNFVWTKKVFDTSKKNFLWLGSNGAIHKGLDLLLDIFEQQNDIHLHICGLSDKDRPLLKAFKSKNNIIDYGRIDIQGQTFLELVEKCAFIILPSCSEAMSTSIATGMLHGLIPIVMKNSGFEKLGDNGIFLSSYVIEDMTIEIQKIAQTKSEHLLIQRQKCHLFAHKNFTPNAYNKKITQILNRITTS